MLITGASGFVAKHFVEYLVKNNLKYDILGIDIAENCSIKADNFKYKQLNLLNKNELLETLSEFQPKYILHLASISSVKQSWDKPVESFVNNTNLFLNLIESVRELKLDTKVLSVGSSEEYGFYESEKMPLKEEYPLQPNSPYSIARVSQEWLSKLYSQSLGINIIMTRSFNHIGVGQRENFVVASFVKQLVDIKKSGQNGILKVGNIEVIRDFLDVRDVVDAYYKLLLSGKSGEVYNVCSGIGISLNDVILKISEILEITPNIQTDKEKIRIVDNPVVIGDNSKLKKEINWQQSHSLEDSLKTMINELME